MWDSGFSGCTREEPVRERRTAVWIAGGFALVIVVAMAARVPLPAARGVHWLLILGLGLVFVGMVGLTLARERDTGVVAVGMAAVVLGLGLLTWPDTGVLRGIAIGASVGVLAIIPRLLRDSARAEHMERRHHALREGERIRGGGR